jgi:hypothetical protein
MISLLTSWEMGRPVQTKLAKMVHPWAVRSHMKAQTESTVIKKWRMAKIPPLPLELLVNDSQTKYA